MITVTVFRWMEVYPEKWPYMYITSCTTYMMRCTVHFFGVYLHAPKNYYCHSLILFIIIYPSSSRSMNKLPLIQNLTLATFVRNCGAKPNRSSLGFNFPYPHHDPVKDSLFLPPQTEFFPDFRSNSQCCLSLVVFTYLGKDSFAWVNTLRRHKSYNDVTSWLTQVGTVF